VKLKLTNCQTIAYTIYNSGNKYYIKYENIKMKHFKLSRLK